MSVSYAPVKLRVPPGFEYVLEGLTREILREQPKDIIAFAADYFKKKLILRDAGGVEDTNVPTPVLEPIDMDLKEPKVSSNGEVSKEPAASKGDVDEPEEIDIDLSDPEVGKAASVIQSSFRARMARKTPKPDATQPSEEAEKVKEAPLEEEIDIDLNDPEVHKAASAIQMSFRAHMARKSSKEPTESKEKDTETASEVELASGGGESELESAGAESGVEIGSGVEEAKGVESGTEGTTSEVEVNEDGPVDDGSSAESPRAAEGKVEGDEVVKEDPSPPTDAGKADSGEEGPSGD